MTFHPAQQGGPGDVEEAGRLSPIAAGFAEGIEQPHPFVFEGFLFDRFQRFRRTLTLSGRGLRGRIRARVRRAHLRSRFR